VAVSDAAVRRGLAGVVANLPDVFTRAAHVLSNLLYVVTGVAKALLEFHEALSEGAADFGQAAAEDEQGDDPNDNHLGNADLLEYREHLRVV